MAGVEYSQKSTTAKSKRYWLISFFGDVVLIKHQLGLVEPSGSDW
jgi:hypothetical protein